MASTSIARLGDTSDHGGVIITASENVNADGIGVAREGDLHSCPIPGHGVTPLVSGSTRKVNGKGVIRIGNSEDHAGCGAIITQGSPTVKAET